MNAPMHLFLKVLGGLQDGKLIQVADSFTTLIGRSKRANGTLSDPRVSRIHCEVEIRGKKVYLSDLDSASGTFVNGKRVHECVLKIGDVVRVGDTQLKLQAPGAEDSSTLTNMPVVQARPALLTTAKLAELVGNTLSHFEVQKLIGKGQMGLVFQAQDIRIEQDVALKVLCPEFSRIEEEMQRFVRAMRTMMPLKHPNLVALRGAGRTGPYAWVAMELVAGESLTQVIRRIGTANMLDPERVLKIGYGIVKGLEYAHGEKVIHRNLTPQNVLVTRDKREVKIGDLMLAKAFEGTNAQTVTQPGEILGDVRFMAPERISEAPNIDDRSDLYSLGALMYALLTGKPPFEGLNILDTLTKITLGNPERPKTYQLAVPTALEDLVLGLLACRPESRPQSATEVRKQMEHMARFMGGLD